MTLTAAERKTLKRAVSILTNLGDKATRENDPAAAQLYFEMWSDLFCVVTDRLDDLKKERGYV